MQSGDHEASIILQLWAAGRFCLLAEMAVLDLECQASF